MMPSYKKNRISSSSIPDQIEIVLPKNFFVRYKVCSKENMIELSGVQLQNLRANFQKL
ncbi:uncharacterized protein G2W53_028756 [Senna tora]|uniref:Uncharacterized protein n=1 Tax=Senna tora TaxID=362788 RepID=A0A834T6H4_9FABA|nr:uncharacterized protein G2W53_028756 [Senna tora]